MKKIKGLWAIVLSALVLMVALPAGAQSERKPLTVKTIFQFLPRQLYGSLPQGLQWLPKRKQYSFLKMNKKTKSQELWIHDAHSGREGMVLSNAKLIYITAKGDTQHLSLRGAVWTPKEDGLVLPNRRDIWYYNLNTEKLTRLTDSEDREEQVTLSPDGKQIAFIRGYDLYALDIATGKETRLTTNGNADLYNGKLDWVYQEELVGRGKFQAFWWSPDSRHIAYLQFNEKPVPRYPLVDWLPHHPTTEMERYPKAGDGNPIVKLGVISTAGGETVWMDTGDDSDIYLPRVYWLPDGKELAFMRLDRLQQNLEFLFADPLSGKSRLVLKEGDPQWINVGDFVYFFKKKKQFLWGSERSGFRHLYLYDYQGKQLKQLTSGNWMVDGLASVDERSKWIYFTSTKADIAERQLYRVRTDGTRMQRLTHRSGTHRARMPNGGKYFIDYFSDPTTPYRADLFRADGKKMVTISAGAGKLLQEYQLKPPEFLDFTGGNGILYHAMMYKPSDFDPAKKYPVLIYVYGGPHAQVIRKAHGGTRQLWHQMMAEKGYIVFSMDNRGAWGRGHDWEKVIYRHMGKTELADQLEGVKYLKSLPYVDANRIGIWGWSYGGYMTLYSLTHSDAFRTGVSVAPVTDWRNYDTIYTERYMGVPQDNQEGYDESSPAYAAKNLHGKLLLVHGTGDDNVHMQNSIQMIQRLIEAGKAFQLMMYPNQKHGISATPDRVHLFNMITDFLDKNLKGD